MISKLVPVAAVLLLSATCLSCIRRETVIPEIHGVVLHQGVGLHDSTVEFQVLTYGETRSEWSTVESVTTATDQDGRFSFEQKTGFGIQIPLPADSLIPIRLCVEGLDNVSVCWHVELFGPPDLPEIVAVSCDLSEEPICMFLEPVPRSFRVIRSET